MPAISVAWVALLYIVFFLPSVRPVTKENMNYVSVVSVGLMVLCLLFISSRRGESIGDLGSLGKLLACSTRFKSVQKKFSRRGWHIVRLIGFRGTRRIENVLRIRTLWSLELGHSIGYNLLAFITAETSKFDPLDKARWRVLDDIIGTLR